MNATSTFWLTEYAAKAQSASAFAQSGRSAAADPVEFLHAVRRMLRLLAPKPGHQVLDIGCGNGLLDLVLSGLCAHVIAVERVPELAEQARRNTADCGNVTVLVADAAEMIDLRQRFDRVLIWEALQLMEPAGVHALFARLAEWLGPDGRIVLGAVPDASHREGFLCEYLRGVRASGRLSPVEKEAIVARNERAQWYDASELAAWWADVGGKARRVALQGGREKSDHRFDMVLTWDGAEL